MTEFSKVKALVEEVSSSSHEQRRGIEQVAQAIAQMEQTTQQTAAGAGKAPPREQLTAQSDQPIRWRSTL
jgi:methyl-accepting chemotaxis protein-4 (peptide sensor receptor)